MKKITRLAALLLAIALLLGTLSASATEEGIPLEELDLETYSSMLMAAEESDLTQEEVAEMVAACGDHVYCNHVKNMLALETAQEKYEYLMALYVAPEEIPEGEESNPAYCTLEYTLWHYAQCHVEDPDDFSTYEVCTCNFPMLEPDCLVGDISKHEADCPWHFANLSAAEQYAVATTLASYDEETYLATLSDEQAAALTAYAAAAEGVIPTYPCEEKPEWCLYSEYSAMSQDELYAYFNNMYSDGLAEGEEGPSELYTAVLLHYAEYHMDSNLLCTCGVHPMPQPGTAAHETACPWYSAKEQILTGAAGTIVGELPDGLTGSVESADVQTAVEESIVDSGEYTGATTVKAFEVKVLQADGSEWQPESALKITLQGVWDASLTKPLVKLYLLLDTASAIEAAQANGTLMTSSDAALVAARTAEVAAAQEAGLGAVVAYTALSSADGAVTLNADGSITFEMDSFSTVVTVSGEALTCEDFDCEAFFSSDWDALDRYTYMMGHLYDESNTLEAFMLHLYAAHEAQMVENICICTGSDSLLYAPGSVSHTGDDELGACAWAKDNLDSIPTAAELYAAYSELDVAGKAYFLMGLDDDQKTELEKLLSDSELEDEDYLDDAELAAWMKDEDVAQWLKTEAIASWRSDKAPAVETLFLAKKELDKGVELAQAMAVNRKNQLLWLYEDAAMANINAYGYIVDVATGIAVGQYDSETGSFTMGTGLN